MNPFHSCRALFRPLAYSLLLLAALPVQAQYTFTLLADQPSFGIEPELRPYIAGSEVAFSGRLPTDIFKAGPNGTPAIMYASNSNIPGVKPTEPFSIVSLVDYDGGPFAFIGVDKNSVERTFAATSQGFVQLAGQGSNVPQATGSVIIRGDDAVFVSNHAVYAWFGGKELPIADASASLPGGGMGETFRFIFGIGFDGQYVAISADGSQGSRGIYIKDILNDGPLQKFVDNTDTAPGGQTQSTYDAFGAIAMEGGDLVFFAEMKDGREALFLSSNLARPTVLSDKDLGSGITLDPSAPNDFGRVDRIFDLSISNGEVAVVARDEGRDRSGLYVTENGVFKRILATGDDLQGRTVDTVTGGPRMLDARALAIGVYFTNDVRAIYRLDSNAQALISPSGMITNGSFSNGLNSWNTMGQVQTVPGPAIQMTSDTDPGVGTAELSQVIDTYNGTFMIWFDYQFTTTAGSLDILINNTLVDSIQAPATVVPYPQLAQVTVNDPALMGLLGATLTLKLQPGSLAEILLNGLFSPIIQHLANIDTGTRVEATGDFGCGVSNACPMVPFMSDQAPLGVFSLASTQGLDGENMVGASATALTSIFGIQWGFKATGTAQDYGVGSGGWIANTAIADYQVYSTMPEAVPVTFDLVFDGSIVLTGDFAQNLTDTRATLEIFPKITTPRFQESNETLFNLRRISLEVDTTDRDQRDLKVSPVLKQVMQQSPSSVLVTDWTTATVPGNLFVDVNAAVVSTNTVYLPPGEIVRLWIEGGEGRQSNVNSRVEAAFDGTVNINFFDSFTARLKSGTEDALLVPMGLDPDFEINAGHGGAWFNTDTPGQGFFADIEPDSQFLFLSWFTYTDAEDDNPGEQHWYTAQGNYNGAQAELVVYETLGGKFDDPQAVGNEAVGTASVIFSDCETGQLLYQLTDGRQGIIPLTRVIPGSERACEDLASASPQAVDINAGMDGAWFEPDTAGQGFFMDAHADSQFIFVSWFTYGDGTASGQRWLTAQGNFAGSKAEDLPITETTGGLFDDPQAVSNEQVGTLTIDFEDCDNATLTYSLTDDGLEGDIELTRVVAGTEDLCNDLAAPH